MPSRDSPGCCIRVHGQPPHVQCPSRIQLASNRLQPIATVVQEAANEGGIFMERAAHHQANPQQVGEPVEDDLEESETEGLVGTLEIIGPSPETFAQLPLPSAQPSIIPRPSPSQRQTPPQPPLSHLPPPPLPPPPHQRPNPTPPPLSPPPPPQNPPPGSTSNKCGETDAEPSPPLNTLGPTHATKPASADASAHAINTNSHSCS